MDGGDNSPNISFIEVLRCTKLVTKKAQTKSEGMFDEMYTQSKVLVVVVCSMVTITVKSWLDLK